MLLLLPPPLPPLPLLLVLLPPVLPLTAARLLGDRQGCDKPFVKINWKQQVTRTVWRVTCFVRFVLPDTIQCAVGFRTAEHAEIFCPKVPPPLPVLPLPIELHPTQSRPCLTSQISKGQTTDSGADSAFCCCCCHTHRRVSPHPITPSFLSCSVQLTHSTSARASAELSSRPWG